MRRGDHREVAPAPELGQPVDCFDRLHAFGGRTRSGKRSTPRTDIPKARARRAISQPIPPMPTIPIVASRKVDRRQIHRIDDVPGPVIELDPCRLAALGLVPVLDLLADIRVQIAGETEYIAHHLIGNHVAEKARARW